MDVQSLGSVSQSSVDMQISISVLKKSQDVEKQVLQLLQSLPPPPSAPSPQNLGNGMDLVA